MRSKQKKENSTSTLYDFDSENKKEEKLRAKRRKAELKSASKKKNKKALKKDGQASNTKKYNDEIIIGVTRYPEKKVQNDTLPKNQKKKNDKERKKRRNNQENREEYNVRVNNDKLIKDNSEKKQNTYKVSKKKRRIIKIVCLLIILAGAVAFALLSPLFNVQTVEVIGNKQVSKEEIKSLSGIQLGENIFKISIVKTISSIKENAYINDVKIHRNIPSTIQIEVTEREPSYMLEYGNGYVYINNQGYMLEISSIKKELPIIEGVVTSKEEYKAGNRLEEEDLVKLSTVIKIMNSAETNNISSLITKIDISDKNNYTLYLDSENKKAYLGDCSNLETRMLFLAGIIEKEKGNTGEIFINMNLNTDDAYFRESV